MDSAKQEPENKVVAVSTNGLPCNHDNPNAAAVLITYDDLKFSGLQETVRLTTGILGHGSDQYSSCKFRKYWKNRAFSPCDLESIRTSLRSDGWCMKDPQEFHDPGKPVQTILPGSMLSWSEQCAAIGPNVGNICPGSGCHALRCIAKDFVGFPCQFRHPAMDGSVCATEQICLNGECVSNMRLEYDWWMARYEDLYYR